MGRRLRVGIVTPANRASNNGNWQTAWRWSRLLAGHAETRILNEWAGEPVDVLLALHARRSAASIEAWHAAGAGPLAVVLTGTDLYGDFESEPQTRLSLERADRLVVLQELGAERLPAQLRDRVVVCFQSCSARLALPKSRRGLRVLMVGHLREEKSPGTYFEAARRLADRADLRLDHIGAPLDAALGREALALTRAGLGYRWLGALDRDATRRRIQRAHLLVHASRLEGGAHVIAEAVRSGTPVVASRVDGNVGMLGPGYGGYVDWNDAGALARVIRRCRDEAALLPALQAQCAARAPLFEPERERQTLVALLDGLTGGGAPRPAPASTAIPASIPASTSTSIPVPAAVGPRPPTIGDPATGDRR